MTIQKEYSMNMQELIILRNELNSTLTRFCQSRPYNFSLDLTDGIDRNGAKLTVKITKQDESVLVN